GATRRRGGARAPPRRRGRSQVRPRDSACEAAVSCDRGPPDDLVRWDQLDFDLADAASPLELHVDRPDLRGYGTASQEQLGDLNRVQRGALAEVVADDEQDESVALGRVRADPADEHVV